MVIFPPTTLPARGPDPCSRHGRYEYTGAGTEASVGRGWFDYIHPDDIAASEANWTLMSPDQVS